MVTERLTGTDRSPVLVVLFVADAAETAQDRPGRAPAHRAPTGDPPGPARRAVHDALHAEPIDVAELLDAGQVLDPVTSLTPFAPSPGGLAFVRASYPAGSATDPVRLWGSLSSSGAAAAAMSWWAWLMPGTTVNRQRNCMLSSWARIRAPR